MSNASLSLRTVRTLTCASLATLMFAACGGGGGGNPATDTASAVSGSSSANSTSTTAAGSASFESSSVESTPAPATASAGSKSSSTGTTSSAKPSNTATAASPFGQDAGNYTLTFSEEFNSFNTDLWNDHMWYESSNPTKNYTVEDGKLKIWPQRDASGRFFNRTIDSDGNYTQKYGYFEIEAKLPKGKGTWPAFWLFNHIGERRPEMDVMEAYAGGEGWGHNDSNGVARPTVYAATVWEGASDSNNRQLGFKMFDAKTDLSEGFHKYAVKWEPNKQTYYFDGKEILVLNISMNDPMYLMLDLWQGSAAGMMDDSTPQGKSNSYEVNYVRAWQFK